MPEILVISDANVLIDIECGDLLEPMFRLEFRIAVPDVLYEDELRENHPGLVALGLLRMELTAESVQYVVALSGDPRSKGVGRYDIFALALARQEDCLLLTGDNRMRALAEAEGREVHGTLWLVRQMVLEGRIRPVTARRAYDAMRSAGRRLPWADVEKQMKELETPR